MIEMSEMAETIAYYFGCWDRVGHHLFGIDGRTVFGRQIVGLETSLDGGFCPRLREQPQGQAALHYVNGWTVLAFWDRSIDDRHGSHSTFVLRGTLDFDDAVAAARSAFASIWKRFTFEVVLQPSITAAESRR